MKTVKKLMLLLVLTVSGQSLYAQFGMGKIEEIEQIKSRKLIVLIEEPQERVTKKLTKKHKDSELKNYKKALQEYNAELKDVVEKYWPYKENGIEYKTFKEVEAIYEKGNHEYAILYCCSQEPSSFGAGFIRSGGLNWTWDMKNQSDDRDYMDYFTTLNVDIIESLKGNPTYQTPLPDVFPTKAALVFGINATNTYFDYRIRKKVNKEKINPNKMVQELIKTNAPRLKNMTLMLRKDWLNEDLPASAVKYSYPYKYKVCTKEELDDIIMQQKDATAYLLILPYVDSGSHSNSITYVHYIYDAKTNEMLAMVRPSIGSMIGAAYIGGKAGKRTIEKKNLEKFKEEIEGKD